MLRILYLTWQKVITSNSISQWIETKTFEHLKVWFSMWLNKTVQSAYQIDITYRYFIRVSRQQSHNVLSEFCWMYWLIYFGLRKSDLIYLCCKNHLVIVWSIKLTLSSEFDCLIIWISARFNFWSNTKFKAITKHISKQLHFMFLPSKLSGSNCLSLNILLKVHLLENN